METIVERKQTQNKYGIPIVHALVSQAKAVVLRPTSQDLLPARFRDDIHSSRVRCREGSWLEGETGSAKSKL